MLNWREGATEVAARLIAPRIIRRVVKPVAETRAGGEFKNGKILIFIGGGQASGKSVIKKTIVEGMRQEGYPPENIASFGSDMFARVFKNPFIMRQRERFAAFSKGAITGKKGMAHEVVNKVFARTRTEAFAKGTPVIMDYHMDNPTLVRQVVGEARSFGYECVFIAPHANMSTIMKRLEKRKAETGRPYNNKRVVESHVGFAKNVTEYFQLFDGGIILDNGQEGVTPTAIAVARKGKVRILNQGVYNELLDKAHIPIPAIPENPRRFRGPHRQPTNKQNGAITLDR